MKFVAFAAAVVAVCAAVLLAGCNDSPELLDGGDEYNRVDRTGMKIVAFSYSERGTTADSFMNYEINKQGDGACFLADFIVYDSVEVQVDPGKLDELAGIVAKYDLDRWNGFDESDSMILDGSSFSISYEYEDGFVVYAHGSNAFPEGYGAASGEIMAIFDELVAPYLSVDEDGELI